ncbi:hypothetical protein D3C72_1732330 [compost metagenome]
MVSAPTEIRSTPVSAKVRMVSALTPPDTSSNALPWLIFTAPCIIGTVKLSSSTDFAPAARASSSSASDSTSTCTDASVSSASAACIAAVMLPAAAIWFSLIRMPSYSASRWFSPPPMRTAYFCARRRPGSVLRVSSTRARVPAIRSA